MGFQKPSFHRKGHEVGRTTPTPEPGQGPMSPILKQSSSHRSPSPDSPTKSVLFNFGNQQQERRGSASEKSIPLEYDMGTPRRAPPTPVAEAPVLPQIEASGEKDVNLQTSHQQRATVSPPSGAELADRRPPEPQKTSSKPFGGIEGGGVSEVPDTYSAHIPLPVKGELPRSVVSSVAPTPNPQRRETGDEAAGAFPPQLSSTGSTVGMRGTGAGAGRNVLGKGLMVDTSMSLPPTPLGHRGGQWGDSNTPLKTVDGSLGVPFNNVRSTLHTPMSTVSGSSSYKPLMGGGSTYMGRDVASGHVGNGDNYSLGDLQAARNLSSQGGYDPFPPVNSLKPKSLVHAMPSGDLDFAVEKHSRQMDQAAAELSARDRLPITRAISSLGYDGPVSGTWEGLNSKPIKLTNFPVASFPTEAAMSTAGATGMGGSIGWKGNFSRSVGPSRAGSTMTDRDNEVDSFLNNFLSSKKPAPKVSNIKPREVDIEDEQKPPTLEEMKPYVRRAAKKVLEDLKDRHTYVNRLKRENQAALIIQTKVRKHLAKREPATITIQRYWRGAAARDQTSELLYDTLYAKRKRAERLEEKRQEALRRQAEFYEDQVNESAGKIPSGSWSDYGIRKIRNPFLRKDDHRGNDASKLERQTTNLSHRYQQQTMMTENEVAENRSYAGSVMSKQPSIMMGEQPVRRTATRVMRRAYKTNLVGNYDKSHHEAYMKPQSPLRPPQAFPKRVTKSRQREQGWNDSKRVEKNTSRRKKKHLLASQFYDESDLLADSFDMEAVLASMKERNSVFPEG